MQNISVSISYGADNSLTRSVPQGTKVGQLLADPAIKAALGFGDNVQAVIDGARQEAGATLRNGDEIVVESRACAKA